MADPEFAGWGADHLMKSSELSIAWWAVILSPLIAGILGLAYTLLLVVAPLPRPPRKSEKSYVSVLPDGSTSHLTLLPCWYDDHIARKKIALKDGTSTADTHTVEPAEVFITVVVPAYNEETRLTGMLEEAVEFLDRTYSTLGKEMGKETNGSNAAGWEILLVSDGSKDQTVSVALDFARKHLLGSEAVSNGKGVTKTRAGRSREGSGSLRVVVLEQNRGKGGAVTHGMRHARGRYVAFADADGASRFSDIAALVAGCDKVQDAAGRAVAVGSRHHLVGSEVVVERSFLRNTLMHSFHLLLRLMTPPKTAAIKDTQCGFKMFTRPALPYIIPYMHVDGWIFDVEMLMLAELASIPMVEVSIGWKEVKGSKLNVIWDSLGMAWSLFVLRAAWLTGVYQRDF